MLRSFLWQDVGQKHSPHERLGRGPLAFEQWSSRRTAPRKNSCRLRGGTRGSEWYIYISLAHTRQVSRGGKTSTNVAPWAVVRGSGFQGLRDLHGLHLGDEH